MRERLEAIEPAAQAAYELPGEPGLESRAAMAGAAISNLLNLDNRDEAGVMMLGKLLPGGRGERGPKRNWREWVSVRWGVYAAGTGLALTGMHACSTAGLGATVDMQGGHTEAHAHVIKFENRTDLRTAVITFTEEEPAAITFHFDSPGPGDFAPDPDTNYDFKGLGQDEIFYPVNKNVLEQKVVGPNLDITLHPAAVISNMYWQERTMSQSDDNERALYGALDKLGDFVGLIPGVSGSNLDEKIHGLDQQVENALDGKGLQNYGEKCAPILNNKIVASVEDAITNLAVFQGTPADHVRIHWIPGAIDYSYKDNTTFDPSSLSIDSFSFDKSDCTTAQMKETQ